jgi:acyl-CoA synthetase (NDP forming)
VTGAAAGPHLRSLFAPRGVLVVGASSDPDKLGGAMAVQLRGYPQPVALVNSRGGDGMHRTVAAAAAAVTAAGGRPDLAVLCVPAAACADVIEECGRHGVGAALICAGGFAEAGPDGAAVQQRLVGAARRAGVRMLGPNTSGFFVPHRSLRASFVPGVSELAAGRVAIVAASGGLNHALAFAFAHSGVGLSLGIGIGAGADVTAVDVLHHLAADPMTSAVALHLENVADGPALLDAVRATSRRKPVVALVIGRHDIGAFAQSHTGALATSWRTTRSVLRQAGAVVVDRADDLVVAATALSDVRLPAGSAGRVALITAQAGPGLLIADALQDAGVRLPELAPKTRLTLGSLLPPFTYQANPVDTGRPGPRHAEVVEAVAADPEVDLVAVYGLIEPVVDLPASATAATTAGGATVIGVDGPVDEVAAALRSARQRGIAATVGAQALACAVSAIVEDARRRNTTEAVDVPPGAQVSIEAGPWDEVQAKDVFDELGIPTPARRLCADRAAAHAALAALGGPVAVKVCDPDLLHKSDVGGVHLGIANQADLDAALDALAQLGEHPVLVERMAPPGVDLVVGARRDPVFGPIVVLGVGGTATEVYADVAIAAFPASRDQLAALPEQLHGRALLDGFRGQPVVDLKAVAGVLGILGALLLANDHLSEVEINPLRWTADGLLALDAVLVAGKDRNRREPAHQPEHRAVAP